MSGLSLAVAPPSDTKTPGGPPPRPRNENTGVMGGVMGSLRVIELQLMAFIMVFSASGLVPLIDIIFPVFVTAYFIILSRFAFPTYHTHAREVFHGSKPFQAYVVIGTGVGLFLPLAYVLGGFARGDEQAVRAVTPHLFLLSCQILTENLISGLSLFSPPVRALVPLLYTVRRIFVVLDWVNEVFNNKPLPANAKLKDTTWLWFGKVLSTANFIYFSINLFAFLIPRFLPRAFERYFRERDEAKTKSAQDTQANKANPHPPLSEEAKQTATKKTS